MTHPQRDHRQEIVRNDDKRAIAYFHEGADSTPSRKGGNPRSSSKSTSLFTTRLADSGLAGDCTGRYIQRAEGMSAGIRWIDRVSVRRYEALIGREREFAVIATLCGSQALKYGPAAVPYAAAIESAWSGR